MAPICFPRLRCIIGCVRIFALPDAFCCLRLTNSKQNLGQARQLDNESMHFLSFTDDLRTPAASELLCRAINMHNHSLLGKFLSPSRGACCFSCLIPGWGIIIEYQDWMNPLLALGQGQTDIIRTSMSLTPCRGAAGSFPFSRKGTVVVFNVIPCLCS